MKILQINSVYNKGSTGKIVYDIHQELLKREIESIVCYGRGVRTKEKNIHKICGENYSYFNHFISYFTGVPYKGFFFSTEKLINIIKKEKPDIVHVHCLNGYYVNVYKLIEWLKNNKQKTVLTLHAEFMYTGGCGHALECNKWLERKGCRYCEKYHKEFHSILFDRTNYMWRRMIKAFNNFDKEKLIITSVSPWLMERAQKSFALKEYKHFVVMNGLDTEIFHPYDIDELNLLKRKHQIKDERIIFHVTPSFNNDPNHIKGGYYVLELAKMMKNKNIKFIVAGPYDNTIIAPSNVIFLGNISNQVELAKYYSIADVTLLTSKKETFSMVTAESLSCGTTVVGFKAGAPEMIAVKENSSFVEYGDIDSLYSCVQKYIESTKKVFNCDCYSKSIMIKNYLEIYNDLL